MTPLDASAYVYPSNKYIKNYDAFSATINSFRNISNCENCRNHDSINNWKFINNWD